MPHVPTPLRRLSANAKSANLNSLQTSPSGRFYRYNALGNMEKITLTTTGHQQTTSTIFIGAGILNQLTELFDLSVYTKICLVTDEGVPSEYLETVHNSLPNVAKIITVKQGEDHKNIEAVLTIWTDLQAAGCDRRSLVINIGGGIVGDLGGFAAATYMRGIAFIHVPTTLLAQVDATIGGKTGCNFGDIKNLVGSFAQPVGVVIDPETLLSLSERQLNNGFAEVIKHGLIRDAGYFERVTAKKPTSLSSDELTAIISTSCAIKAAVVSADETESGYRKILNFGHTVGHALESLSFESNEPLLHGEAVAVGMIAEARMAVALNILSSAELGQIVIGLTHVGLPTSIPAYDVESALQKMQADKKNQGGIIHFSLLNGIGSAVYDQLVPTDIIRTALESVIAEAL